jgi:hypothetical protein
MWPNNGRRVDLNIVKNDAVRAFWHQAFSDLKHRNDSSQFDRMKAVDQSDPDVATRQIVALANGGGFNFTEAEYRDAVRQLVEHEHAAGEISDEDFRSGSAMSGSLIGCTIACSTMHCCQ